MTSKSLELSTEQLHTVTGSGVLREVAGIIREVKPKVVMVVSPVPMPYPNTANCPDPT